MLAGAGRPAGQATGSFVTCNPAMLYHFMLCPLVVIERVCFFFFLLFLLGITTAFGNRM